ncbi:40S ribosomal protein S5-1 [Hordeum vulgare]|nr:40S ribosomal protein S5-1 [Hordeum vulgare]
MPTRLRPPSSPAAGRLPSRPRHPSSTPAGRLPRAPCPPAFVHRRRRPLPSSTTDKIFEKVINPYLAGVLQHPQSIDMREWMLHIRDVEGGKKTGSMEARLEAMEQQVFKCQGMVEPGLNANHMRITEFTNKHKIDANETGKHLSKLYDRIDLLQA